MIRMLVSVRSVAEARIAVRGGADLIDLKEPKAGALGALPLPTAAAIVAALRADDDELPLISATIGDGPWTAAAAERRVAELAECGVDLVKVGLLPGEHGLLEALGASRHTVVPVFIADRGLDAALVGRALELPFPALMLDTADKRAGSLFDCVEIEALRGFVACVREAGKRAGLAGALRLHHVPRLLELAPDFAGFRSAVCIGRRVGTLDAKLVAQVAAALQRVTAAPS